MKNHKAEFIRKYSCLLILCLFIGCSTSKDSRVSRVKEEQLDNLIAKKNFVIISDMAMPMMTNSMNSIFNSGLYPPGSAGNQISLIGNSNYLKVMGDSVAANLPYYGERQMGGGYNDTDRGINFEGIPNDWELRKNNKKGYDIKFKIRNTSENYNVYIVLLPGNTSMITINSTQRFPIRYGGAVRPTDPQRGE